MFSRKELTAFVVCLCFIQHCTSKPYLGYYNTTIKAQSFTVKYTPILDSEIDTGTIVKKLTPKSRTDCASVCFSTDCFLSMVYETEVQMCLCNDQKMTIPTSISAESESVYGECMLYFQIFSDDFWVKLSLHSFQKDCKDLHDSGSLSNGVYRISPDGGEPFEVYCDMDGGGWTVFQRREDGSVDFNLGWDSYKEGFGHLMGEHWLGLDSLYRLVQKPSELYIELATFEDYDGQRTGYATYSTFYIENEENFYRLTIGGFTGDVGDSMDAHSNGQKFTTKDKDNDEKVVNCATSFKGGWWYKSCHDANLNGLYLAGPTSTRAVGVVWKSGWTHYYSLKRVVMKTRRK